MDWSEIPGADRDLDTGEAVFLPFRMSSFVLTNLVVTAGMLTPGLGVSPPGNIDFQVY